MSDFLGATEERHLTSAEGPGNGVGEGSVPPWQKASTSNGDVIPHP